MSKEEEVPIVNIESANAQFFFTQEAMQELNPQKVALIINELKRVQDKEQFELFLKKSVGCKVIREDVADKIIKMEYNITEKVKYVNDWLDLYLLNAQSERDAMAAAKLSTLTANIVNDKMSIKEGMMENKVKEVTKEAAQRGYDINHPDTQQQIDDEAQKRLENEILKYIPDNDQRKVAVQQGEVEASDVVDEVITDIVINSNLKNVDLKSKDIIKNEVMNLDVNESLEVDDLMKINKDMSKLVVLDQDQSARSSQWQVVPNTKTKQVYECLQEVTTVGQAFSNFQIITRQMSLANSENIRALSTNINNLIWLNNSKEDRFQKEREHYWEREGQMMSEIGRLMQVNENLNKRINELSSRGNGYGGGIASYPMQGGNIQMGQSNWQGPVGNNVSYPIRQEGCSGNQYGFDQRGQQVPIPQETPIFNPPPQQQGNCPPQQYSCPQPQGPHLGNQIPIPPTGTGTVDAFPLPNNIYQRGILKNIKGNDVRRAIGMLEVVMQYGNDMNMWKELKSLSNVPALWVKYTILTTPKYIKFADMALKASIPNQRSKPTGIENFWNSIPKGYR